MYRMLKKCKAEFGNLVTHVLDRGYANARIIEWMIEVFQQDFIFRWKSNYNLINDEGIVKKTYLISRSHRAVDSRLVQDKKRKKYKNITIAFAKVFHPDYPEKALSLVIVRDKKKPQLPHVFTHFY